LVVPTSNAAITPPRTGLLTLLPALKAIASTVIPSGYRLFVYSHYHSKMQYFKQRF
jgi:hypothetical protein